MEGVTRKDNFRLCEWCDRRCWRSSHVVYTPQARGISTINNTSPKGCSTMTSVPWKSNRRPSPTSKCVDPGQISMFSSTISPGFNFNSRRWSRTGCSGVELSGSNSLWDAFIHPQFAGPFSYYNQPTRHNISRYTGVRLYRGEGLKIPERSMSSPWVPSAYPASTK